MYGARRILETPLGLISSLVFSWTNHSPQDICGPHKFLDILSFFTSSNILNLQLTKTSNHPMLGEATPRVNPTRICQTSCVLFSSITHSPLHYWSNQSNQTIVIKIQQWNNLWINLSCLSLFSSVSINHLHHINLRCRISRSFTGADN